MNDSNATTPAPAHRGLKRSTRMSIIAGVAVFLTLVSGVSFATWNTSTEKAATVTAGNIAVSTAPQGGAATIPALGPHTYQAKNETIARPLTVRNTGTVSATLNNVAISSTGSLPGNTITITFWASTGTGCTAGTPGRTATLASGGTVDLTPLAMTVSPNTSTTLCASTQFTGEMAPQAGKSITATLALSTSAGTHWMATDSLSAADRSFTQTVRAIPQLAAPSNMSCSTGGSWFFGTQTANISWTPPSIPAGNTITYTIVFTSSSGTSVIATTTNTSVTLTSSQVQADGAVSVIASAPNFTDSPNSASRQISYSTGWFGGGVSCG